ncbi:MAG: competence/damage-inducible protein A [Solirubrobacterales bacterium]|nr:competence/damage-inducible protein A [Solirubrobacterales bacterium]
MSARAGIVVTGTEVLTGRVRDRNGPWLSDRLRELGIDLAHITICGDRPEDMEAQLRFLADQGCDLILTSGGLGPTADDLTLEIVARFAGVELALDPELEERIAAILRPLIKRWPHLDPEAVLASNRKQALVPEGATVLAPVGTAPGMAVPAGARTPAVVVLPGPPRELARMWPDAVASPPFQAVLARATEYSQTMVRLFGIPESEIAETLRVAEEAIGDGFSDLEITTCLRRGEVEVVTRYEAHAEGSWTALERVLGERHGDTIFSTDGSSVDEQVARLLDGRTIAVAESCTGGLLAARLTELPGSSAYFAGGVVAYSDAAKAALLGVDAALIEARGAVSAEVAEALAAGAIERFGADVGVGVTGIAGPGGGSEAKPVGTVYVSVRTAGGEPLTRHLTLPGGRDDVRDRTTTVALHLLRRQLAGGAPAPR